MGLYGWRLFSLICAALIGGYLMAAAAGIFLAGVVPDSRGAAALTGTMASFAVYAGAIIWVFAMRRPARAWASLILASAVLATTGMILGRHSL
ncbi:MULTISPECIES: hypothetical protein [Marinobacter]|uniref:DUF3649 domain-containing protein n=1 Tax=Marinobacter salexigens TaxID=1925763 RepID=A0ABS6A410_9GAMM|nr:hypothetical protein [Marinobacter salexigens]MBU2872895.1 hypothetical protein [Marinobacter salexigens]